MAITAADLGIALRISADGLDLDAAQTSILNRLLGVADAQIELLIPGAPDAIKDQISVQFGAYLYDMPSAGRRDSFANAWINSGAGSLAARWLTQTIAGETGVGPSRDTSGDVTVERVESLIADALAAYDPGVGAPVLTATIAVSNAALKNLDTNYVEILPAPGIGQYLEVMQFWIHKSGSDLPPTHTPIYRIAVSPDVNLSEAEALAGNSLTHLYGDVPFPAWTDPRYLFVGEAITDRDILNLDGLDFSGQFVPAPDLTVDGVSMKWWRTNVTYPDKASLSNRVGTRFRQERMGTVSTVIDYASLYLLFQTDPTEIQPLNDGFRTVSRYELDYLLRRDDSSIIAYSIGGQSLIENTALSFGLVVAGGDNGNYSAAAYDAYMADVNDAILTLFVRYSVHSIYDFN